MTVTERLMKPGSFSVRLREDYPWSVASAVDVFDHIVITPTRLDPIAGFSDADILAAAIYTGVVTSKPSPRIFEGAGLAWWLGTDEGLGDLLDTAVTNSAATLSTWVTSLRPASLSAGTVSNTGLGTHSATYQWMTRREALDAVCRALGAEWRVNPSFTLDAAKSPDLFVSTPTVVVTRKEEGQDGDYRGLEGSLIVTAKDVEQYTTKVIAVTAGSGATVSSASSSGSTSYKDGLNGTVVLERLVDAPSDASTNASAIAAAQVGIWNQVRRQLSLSSRTYTVTRFVRPGDYVYAYDQLAELTDSSNQITYRGELISPIELRVHALTWPVEQGMGVYARRSGATPTYTDLTDFVEWENGNEVQWDVGTAARSANDIDAARAGSSAYLGANPAVAARATSGTPTSYTPTWSNTTLGNGTSTGGYSVSNGWCHWWARFTLGSTSAVSGGGHQVSLPTPSAVAAVVDAGLVLCGFKDAGNYYYPGFAAYDMAGSGAANLYTLDLSGGYSRAVNFSATTPFTFGTGDVLLASGSYPIA